MEDTFIDRVIAASLKGKYPEKFITRFRKLSAERGISDIPGFTDIILELKDKCVCRPNPFQTCEDCKNCLCTADPENGPTAENGHLSQLEA